MHLVGADNLAVVAPEIGRVITAVADALDEPFGVAGIVGADVVLARADEIVVDRAPTAHVVLERLRKIEVVIPLLVVVLDAVVLRVVDLEHPFPDRGRLVVVGVAIAAEAIVLRGSPADLEVAVLVDPQFAPAPVAAIEVDRPRAAADTRIEREELSLINPLLSRAVVPQIVLVPDVVAVGVEPLGVVVPLNEQRRVVLVIRGIVDRRGEELREAAGRQVDVDPPVAVLVDAPLEHAGVVVAVAVQVDEPLARRPEPEPVEVVFVTEAGEAERALISAVEVFSHTVPVILEHRGAVTESLARTRLITKSALELYVRNHRRGAEARIAVKTRRARRPRNAHPAEHLAGDGHVAVGDFFPPLGERVDADAVVLPVLDLVEIRVPDIGPLGQLERRALMVLGRVRQEEHELAVLCAGRRDEHRQRVRG